MGVPGLLGFLKDIQERCHIRDFAGKTVGIDIANWLYRGSYSSALELFKDVHSTDTYIIYCIQRLQLMRAFDVRPVVVFDGAPLPIKAEEKANRNERKEEVHAHTAWLLSEGKEAEAAEMIQRGLDVSFDMRHKMVQACRRLDIEYVVAPYEADAQLAYMFQQGLIDAVITEDSDLIAFGVTDVLLKMDGNGHGFRLRYSRIGEIKLRDGRRKLNLKDLTLEQFQCMCILSGCDYLPKHSPLHIKGVSLKTACKIVLCHRTIDRILNALQRKFTVPDTFSDAFFDALCAFRHQVVWDPVKATRCALTPLDTATTANISTSSEEKDAGSHDSTTASTHSSANVRPSHSADVCTEQRDDDDTDDDDAVGGGDEGGGGGGGNKAANAACCSPRGERTTPDSLVNFNDSEHRSRWAKGGSLHATHADQRANGQRHPETGETLATPPFSEQLTQCISAIIEREKRRKKRKGKDRSPFWRRRRHRQEKRKLTVLDHFLKGGKAASSLTKAQPQSGGGGLGWFQASSSTPHPSSSSPGSLASSTASPRSPQRPRRRQAQQQPQRGQPQTRGPGHKPFCFGVDLSIFGSAETAALPESDTGCAEEGAREEESACGAAGERAPAVSRAAHGSGSSSSMPMSLSLASDGYSTTETSGDREDPQAEDEWARVTPDMTRDGGKDDDNSDDMDEVDSLYCEVDFEDSEAAAPTVAGPAASSATDEDEGATTTGIQESRGVQQEHAAASHEEQRVEGVQGHKPQSDAQVVVLSSDEEDEHDSVERNERKKKPRRRLSHTSSTSSLNRTPARTGPLAASKRSKKAIKAKQQLTLLQLLQPKRAKMTP